MSLIFNYHKDLAKVMPLKAEYLKNQVVNLKSIFQPEQKTKEWYDMRNTMLTASDWGTVLGENHYSNSNEVLKKKCGDNTFITNAAMQWGNKYESVAVLIYEKRNNVKVYDFGCLKHPFIDFLGASPDGITAEGIMLEIKCPSSRKITGIPPSYYWCQVQGQLEVCDLDRCDFLECSIKEYLNELEYTNDNYCNNFDLNKFGNEKGVVAEFFRKIDKTFYYDYSPIGLIGRDLEIWKENIILKHESDEVMFSCFSYWYLEEVSCVPIYRNQEWFNNAKIELELFWHKVLKYRELGLDKLKDDIQKEKDDKKNAKIQLKEENQSKKVKKDTKKTDLKPKRNQKKIRDFITLDTINNEITMSSSDDSDDDDFVFSTQTNASLF
jgi:putative phage-type endonuclease